VRVGHGRYHVRRDAATGRDYIARDNGAPLGNLDEVALPLAGATTPLRQRAPAEGLAPGDFENHIAATVAEQAAAAAARP
jgi:hypothetical protein